MQTFLDELLRLGFTKRASDIHIEPTTNTIQIRFRIDGVLYKTKEIAIHHSHALFARIKVLANMDIAEKRLPQDGHFRFFFDDRIFFDCRVSTLNTILGEKIVIRLLPQVNMQLFDLGMNEQQQEITIKKLQKSYGLILVCGPTGSGKTRTLYALLDYFNKQQKNICTIEDPVEIQLPGIQQIETQTKIGLTFQTVLRALLRQDPDIILLGEIRDNETALLAIHAANTGHLVLATVHANHTKDAFSRLKHLGVNNYDIEQSVSFIIAQRLIRTLCQICKKPIELDSKQKILLKKFYTQDLNQTIYEAQGCDHCVTGYDGRTALFELSEYHFSLHQHGVEKLLAGVTSFDELTTHLDFWS